jgi:hypothetical protein
MQTKLTDKLQRLIARHRRHVFDEKTGDAHTRAILRLKRTHTFKAMCQANRDAESVRIGERLARMGY